MKCLTRSKALLWAIVLSVVFVLLSTFVPRVALMTVLNGVFLGVATAALIVYSPVIAVSLMKKKLDRVAHLAIGIGLLWSSLVGARIYWLVWNAYGAPVSWQSNPFLAAMVYMAIIGGALFVTAPGYPPSNDHTPVVYLGTNRRLLMLLGGIGGIAAFAASLYFE